MCDILQVGFRSIF